MPTASGAHVLLDDDEFLIDRSVDGHYVKRWYDVDDEEDSPAPAKEYSNQQQ